MRRNDDLAQAAYRLQRDAGFGLSRNAVSALTSEQLRRLTRKAHQRIQILKRADGGRS